MYTDQEKKLKCRGHHTNFWDISQINKAVKQELRGKVNIDITDYTRIYLYIKKIVFDFLYR